MDAVSQRLLSVGDLNLDVTITTSTPLVTGSDNEGRVETFAGGSAANVAAWAARSGGAARFVGVVGTDLSGDFLVGELAQHDVDVLPVRRADGRTRTIAAIIDDGGDRTMVSDVRGAMGLSVDDVDARWLDDAGWLHLTAYTWFNPQTRSAFLELVQLASERAIPFSVDPSAVALISGLDSPTAFLAAVKGAAILFPNDDEAAALTGATDPSRNAAALLDVTEEVAVTCGQAGAYLARRGAPVLHVPAVECDVVNTLGAGDAFAGGYLAARLQGGDVAECGAAGVRSASDALRLASAR